MDGEEIRNLAEKIDHLRLQRERDFSHLDSEDGTIHRKIERIESRIDEKIDKIRQELHEIIFGDGNGKKGLIVKIDRLEQFKKILYAVCGAVLMLAAKTLWDLFTGR